MRLANWQRSALIFVLAIAWSAVAAAQQEVDASAVFLGPSGTTCRFSTGTGSPESAVTDSPCAVYVQRDSPYTVWRKFSGVGTNTGWRNVTITAGSAGTFVRSDGTNIGASTLVLPNAIAQGELLYGSASNVASALGVGTSGYWLKTQGAGANPAWTAPAALTKTDDTNVTLTLGGSASTSLLNAASLTLGWTGRLALSRFAAASADYSVLQGANGSSSTYTTTPTVVSATVNSTATLGATNPAPYQRNDLPLVEQRAWGATRYVGQWWVEPYGSGVFFESFDTTGMVKKPFVFRGSAFTVKSSATIQGNLTTDGDVLPDAGYSRNLGSNSFKWLTVRAGELVVDSLVARDVVSDIGGRVLVASTTTLTRDVSTTDLAITVKHNSLAANDIVRLEANGNVEFMKVLASATGSSGAYVYSVQRNLDGTGINAWVQGDAVVNTGTTGDGFIDLYAETGVLGSGTGPTIVGNVRTGTTYSDVSPRWAIGNLNGLYDYVTDTYGFASGVPTGAWVKVDPTNGVRLGFNATTNFQIAQNGDVTAGPWSLTSTAFQKDTGTNSTSAGMAPADFPFFAGATYANRATAPFRVTPAGALSASIGTVGGWTLASTSLTGGNLSLANAGIITAGTGNDVATLSASDATYRAWIGHASAASAPWAVKKDGSMYLGTAQSSYLAAGALNYNRATANGFGQSGDIYALYSTSAGSDQLLRLENTIVGTGTAAGRSQVTIVATGWNNTGGGSATTAAGITAQSDITDGRLSLSADKLFMLGAEANLTTTASITCDGSTSNNDVNIGNANVVQLTTAGTSTCTVSGFTGGLDGRVLWVLSPTNNSANLVTYAKATSSSSSNQIRTRSGANKNSDYGGGAAFVYSTTDSKWVQIYVF